MTVENQRDNVRLACDHLAPIGEQHELIISRGNGPQIGLLALEEAAYGEVPESPLDVLGAETQGMIGTPSSRSSGTGSRSRSRSRRC
jgi:carbamate kinase